MSLTVYQTDVDGYLVEPIEADEDPLEPGNWLIPAGCVGTKPPLLAANEAARWANGAWSKVPDFRGTVYWLSDGSRHEITTRGVAPPADALSAEPPAPVATPDQIVAALTAAVQRHLDATARTHNYDGILSLCSYATSTNPKFGSEGMAGVAWRDAVWLKCYSIMADVQAGKQAVPTEADLIAALPTMTWPIA